MAALTDSDINALIESIQAHGAQIDKFIQEKTRAQAENTRAIFTAGYKD